jgi:hypothetical protein
MACPLLTDGAAWCVLQVRIAVAGASKHDAHSAADDYFWNAAGHVAQWEHPHVSLVSGVSRRLTLARAEEFARALGDAPPQVAQAAPAAVAQPAVARTGDGPRRRSLDTDLDEVEVAPLEEELGEE